MGKDALFPASSDGQPRHELRFTKTVGAPVDTFVVHHAIDRDNATELDQVLFFPAVEVEEARTMVVSQVITIRRAGQVIYSGAEWPDPYPISAVEPCAGGECHSWSMAARQPVFAEGAGMARCFRCGIWSSAPTRTPSA